MVASGAKKSLLVSLAEELREGGADAVLNCCVGCTYVGVELMCIAKDVFLYPFQLLMQDQIWAWQILHRDHVMQSIDSVKENIS